MASEKAVPAKKDAISTLVDDHKRAKGLIAKFKKFEDSGNVVCDDLWRS